MSPLTPLADDPIRGKSEDILGRAEFASRLAGFSSSIQEPRSVVIGLTGPWGVGKSSVKNMMIENLHESKKIVIDFNVWKWKRGDGVVRILSSQIYSAFNKIPKSQKAKVLSEKWKEYNSYINLSLSVQESKYEHIVSKVTSVWMVIFGIGFIESVAGLTKISHESLAYIGGFLSIVIGMLPFLSAIIDGKSKRYQEAYENMDKLDNLKEELEVELIEAKIPISVFIDDVDRLEEGDLMSLFMNIKENLNLPYITYIVIFDREVVFSMLEKHYKNPQSYVDKIFDLLIHIPEVERQKIDQFIFSNLDNIFGGYLNSENGFSSERWGEVYIEGIKKVIINIRDAKRLLSSLSLLVQYFKNGKILEVNPIDLIILEVIKLKEPDVYDVVKSNGSILSSMDIMHDSEQNRKRLESFDKIASDKIKLDPELIRSLLCQLFPALNLITELGRYAQIEGSEEYRKDRRICHAEMFERYFQLQIPAGQISDAEIQQFIDSTNDADTVIASFNGYLKRGVLPYFCDQLDLRKMDIPIENSKSFMTGVFDFGDIVPSDILNTSLLTPYTRLWRTVAWFLRKDPSAESRTSRFIEAFENSKGLSIPATIISLDGRRDSDSSRSPSIFESRFKDLVEVWCTRIREIASSTPDRILYHNHLGNIIARWLEWGQEDEVKNFLLVHVSEPKAALRVIMALGSRGRRNTYGSSVTTPIWNFSVAEMTKYVDVEWLLNLSRGLSADHLNDDEALALKQFRRAVSGSLEVDD